MSTELRRIYDTIPAQYDRWRSRYTPRLFEDLVAGIGKGSRVLELGPGTGQATDPLLATGCDYLGIELGENLSAFMEQKYGRCPNFRLINDDFLTHDFGCERFDLICSASALHWIGEEAFVKLHTLLRPGGVLAMIRTNSEYRTRNERLTRQLREIYDRYYRPQARFTGQFSYENAVNYGFVGFERREYAVQRRFNADEYAAYSATICSNLTIPEPYKTSFFEGLRQAVLDADDCIVFRDTHVLYLVKKPM